MRVLAFLIAIFFLLGGLGACAMAKGAPQEAVGGIGLLIAVVIFSTLAVCDSLARILKALQGRIVVEIGEKQPHQ